MAEPRQHGLSVAQATLPLPCFFPSVSSVRTKLMPVDYVELLTAAGYPLFLVSAYDISNLSPEHRPRMDDALKKSRERGAAILMDSGNYEGFWKGDPAWVVDRFHISHCLVPLIRQFKARLSRAETSPSGPLEMASQGTD